MPDNLDLRVAKRVLDDDQKVLLQSNEKKDLLIAQGLPPYTEIVRTGVGWSTMSTAAVAGLVVRPTTAAAYEIYNAYPAGGLSMVIDRLFWFNLVSTDDEEGFSGWAAVSTPSRVATAPTDGSFVVRGNSGAAYGGSVIAAAATTVVDSGWFPWGNMHSKAANSTIPFGAISAEVNGRLIVPPGASLNMHVVSSLVGQTFTQGASWYEVQLTTE